MQTPDLEVVSARERMAIYCMAYAGTPSDVRRPQLFKQGEEWVALLGPSLNQGIAGRGPTVESALRAFDEKYLAAISPPAAGMCESP